MLTFQKPQSVSLKTQKEKKPTSAKKIAANQKNSQQSTGPRDCSRTRFNARKHAQRSGVSMLDSSREYRELLKQLMEDTKPQGAIEVALVVGMAAELNRLKRSDRFETDYINQSIESPAPPPFFEGIPTPRLPLEAIHGLLLHQRYGTAAFNKFRRMRSDLEKEQQMRVEKARAELATLDEVTV
jgi:hypothetical protein